jgi:hypothetical protein
VCGREEIEKKARLRDGILAYLEMWLALGSKKGDILTESGILSESDRLNGAILSRLIDYPSKQEADRLGTLRHDENYGVGYSVPMCNPDLVELMRNEGLRGLLKFPSCWPQGVVAREHPSLIYLLSRRWDAGDYLGRLGAAASIGGNLSSLTVDEHYFLLKILRDYPHDQVIFFGSGAPGDSQLLKSLEIPSHRRTGGESRFPYAVEVAPAGGVGAPHGDPSGEGYTRVTGSPMAAETLQDIRKLLMPCPRALVVLGHGVSPEAGLAAVRRLGPLLGAGGLIAASHGRLDPVALMSSNNLKWTLELWLHQLGGKLGFQPCKADSGQSESSWSLYLRQ